MRNWLRRRTHRFRTLRREVKRRLGRLDPLRIVLYGGYVGAAQAFVWGRALEDEETSPPSESDSTLENIARALRQLESDELPQVRADLTLESQTQASVSDAEGYFFARFATAKIESAGEAVSQGERWLPIRAEVVYAPEGAHGYRPVGGKLLRPAPGARFAVISDIDDTVLESHVRNRLKQAYVTLVHNALKRSSYPGTRELYQSLRAGGGQAPFFYLSRSAWNVHPLLLEFIRYQGLPEGPLILRDVGLFTDAEQRRGHKAREIARILATYPALPLILIGDSGQADAQIYADAYRDHPGRVLAILIRNVSGPERQQHLGEYLRARCPDILTLVFDHADEARLACQRAGLARLPTSIPPTDSGHPSS